MSNDTLFTIGEFAQKSGITLRTLRYYDKIGLLKPCSHNEIGHRLYSEQDFARLQKILTLKFIGLSLEEITNIMQYDITDMNFKKSLELQKEIIENKIQHIIMIKKAIDETLQMVDEENILNWDKFIHIINLINMDKTWLEQYENASNLRARINIHEGYSTNKYGWMNWFFDKLTLPSKCKILELGCGDGSLWLKNIARIPKGWDITLTDFSQGMLNDAIKNLGLFSDRFNFKLVNAEEISFDDNCFDVVIANHMLYHISDKEKVFSEVYRVLKKDGLFYASTVGKNHMKELKSIVDQFNSKKIELKSFSLTEGFQLENGFELLLNWFDDITINRYEDNLFVTKPEPIIDYLFSMPDNVKDVFSKDKLYKLYNYLQSEIQVNGGIHITKDTGYFLGKKSNKLY